MKNFIQIQFKAVPIGILTAIVWAALDYTLGAWVGIRITSFWDVAFASMAGAGFVYSTQLP